MPKQPSPAKIAGHIRRVLKDGGSAPHAEGVQYFFKEEIRSRGWYTGELRKVAVRFRRTILKERGLEFLCRSQTDFSRVEFWKRKSSEFSC